jgi:hypothetical protein
MVKLHRPYLLRGELAPNLDPHTIDLDFQTMVRMICNMLYAQYNPHEDFELAVRTYH